MKTRSFLMTGVLCMATIGCFDVAGSLYGPDMVIGAAEAKDYYTRKKINGRWVTGVFPKNGATSGDGSQAKADAEAVDEETPTVNLFGLERLFRPPADSQTKPEKKVAAVDSTSFESASYTSTKRSKPKRLISGTPGVQDKGNGLVVPKERKRANKESPEDRAVERAARKSPSPPAPQAPGAEPKASKEELAAAVARPVQVPQPVVPASVQPYAPVTERNDLLVALQRKARAMAAEEASAVTGSIQAVSMQAAAPTPQQAVVLPVWTARATKPIRSVTLDFDSGIRTVIFQDGTVHEEEVGRLP